MADHLEIEQKYEADASFVLPSFEGLPGVAAVTEPAVYQLDATYFDTADLALSRNKVTLRRRTGGTDAGWHLKLPVRADVRKEVHEPLGDPARVPLRLAAEVEHLTAGQPLHPIASLQTKRTVRRLTGPAGAVLVEVADDQVTARRLLPGGDPLVWREIELEAGPAADQPGVSPAGLLAGPLADAGRLLRDAGARPARSASKLGRLLGESPAW